MPSIGHVAVGLAAARAAAAPRFPRVGVAVFFAAASLLPDLDVIGFQFGVRYGAPWGHRGATHSLLFALGCALVLSSLPSRFGLSRARLLAALACVIASHGLLDALTDGGRGIALLWPFTNQRFFAPWRPIPVAPIGVRFLSARGLYVAACELGLFAPFVLYAFWPKRRAQR